MYFDAIKLDINIAKCNFCHKNTFISQRILQIRQINTIMKPKELLKWSSTILITFLFHVSISFSQKAFPDAIGFGAKCKGAYAGSDTPAILIVDTLCSASVGNELTKRGSLRWAISRNYPRIILFEVSGYIELESYISINNPYVTIAGQTAPNPGITLRNHTLRINTHDVIVQHLRFRLGDLTGDEGAFDAMAIYSGPNTYVDHCSFSWAIDENFSLSSTDNVGNVTVSNCIISEALHDSFHPKEPHSMGMLVRNGDSITIVNNLFAHLGDRAPLVANTANKVVIANNLLYNTSIKNCNIYLKGNIVLLNCSVVGNALIPGNDTRTPQIIRVHEEILPGSKIYLEDNEGPGRTDDPWSVVRTADKTIYRVDSPAIWDSSFIPVPSTSLESYLLPKVGARPADRDAVDVRIINDVINRTGHYINSQDDVGGFPILENNKIRLEIPANPHQDDDNDGYTNLEEWIYQYHLMLTYGSDKPNTHPEIDNQSFSIVDTISSDTYIGKVVATDSDEKQKLLYEIQGGNENNRYSLNSSSGNLYLNNKIEINEDVSDELTVVVTADGENNLSASATVVIYIEHYQAPPTVENHQPEINNQKYVIQEYEIQSEPIGTIIANDPDADQLLKYKIIDGNDDSFFVLDQNTGDLYFNKSEELSFNEYKIYNLLIEVEDNAIESLSDTAYIIVKIIPELREIYIDPTNINDDLENGTIDHPYDSWSDVEWKNGCSYLQKRGTTASEMKINLGAGNIILGCYGEGNKPKINSLATDFALKALEKSDLTIRDLHIFAPDAISCIYILGSSCDNNSVQNCILEGSDYGIRIIDGKKVTLKYNTFNNEADGIYSYAEKTEVYYNIFKGNKTAINISSYISEANIYNNVFYDNTECISTSYASLTLYNNIFYLVDKGDLAIRHEMDKIMSDYNIFYPEQEGFINISDNKYNDINSYKNEKGLDYHSFSYDPLFIDVYNDNFNVFPQSPAIDAGIYVGLVEDYLGKVVPSGNAPDIGLFETFENTSLTSDIIQQSEYQVSNQLIVYPNPSNGIFNISLNNLNMQNSNVQIKNINGKLIYQENMYPTEGNNDMHINISGIPVGIYFLHLSNDRDIFTEIIIIN
jgi:hypothetical protein